MGTEKRRVILHIGYPKTGTSSIQFFLLDNRELLERSGVNFFIPAASYDRRGYWMVAPNAAFVCLSALMESHGLEVDEQTLSTVDVIGRKFRDEITHYPISVLSYENISCYPSLSYLQAVRKHLADIVPDDTQVEIIVYLRRQDEWALSMWKEYVKSHLTYMKDLKTALQEDLVQLLDYDRNLALLEDVFGREQITVRRYGTPYFVGGDILHDFCAAAHIPWQEGFQLPTQRYNISPSLLSVEALHRLKADRQTLSDEDYWLYQQVLRKESAKSALEGMHILTCDERKEMLARYAEGNQRIADRYFDGEPLFSDHVPDAPAWKPDMTRIIEETNMILLKGLILRNQGKKPPTHPLVTMQSRCSALLY